MHKINTLKLSPSRILQAVSLVLLAALISCSQTGKDAPHAEIAHQWSGHYAEVEIPAAITGDRENWKNVWELLPEPMPQWPEGTEAFAVFFAGQRPTGGYRMKTEIIFQDRDVIRVQCSLHPPDGPATTALTYPWTVVALSGVEGREIQARHCGSPLVHPPF